MILEHLFLESGFPVWALLITAFIFAYEVLKNED